MQSVSRPSPWLFRLYSPIAFFVCRVQSVEPSSIQMHLFGSKLQSLKCLDFSAIFFALLQSVDLAKVHFQQQK